MPPCVVVARGPQDVSTELAHLRHQHGTWRRGKHDDLKTLPKGGERGIETQLQESGHEAEAQPWGDRKEGTKDARKSAGLADNCQSNSTSAPN